MTDKKTDKKKETVTPKRRLVSPPNLYKAVKAEILLQMPIDVEDDEKKEIMYLEILKETTLEKFLDTLKNRIIDEL